MSFYNMYWNMNWNIEEKDLIKTRLYEGYKPIRIQFIKKYKRYETERDIEWI